MVLKLMNLNIQSYNLPLLARPEQPLEKHLYEVMQNGVLFIPSNLNSQKKELWKAGLFFHDVGKAEISIQKALYNDRKPSLSHTHLSVIFYYSWLQNYLNKELHELLEIQYLRIIGFGILAHHSSPHRELEFNIFRQLFNKKLIIAKEIFDILKNYGFLIKEKTFLETYTQFIRGYRENIYEFLFKHCLNHNSRKLFVQFYNSLVKSDWYSAMGETLNSYRIESSLYKQVLDPKKSEIHSYIWRKKFFKENILLELPTGFGKTYLGLGYALKTERQKIIYTLPVTTIIEDVYTNLKEKLGNSFLEWYTSKYLVLKSMKEHFEPKQYLEAKYLEKPIIITTLDQILLALLGIERYPLKESSIYNSCIILDEPQLYSPFMLFLFLKFLNDYKEELNVAIMTATFPDFLKEKMQNLFEEPFNKQKEKFFRKFNRTYLDTKYLGQSLSEEKFQQDLVKMATEFVAKGKRVAIIVNTVEKAQELYKKFPNNFPKYLFHARYIYRDRTNKLGKLKQSINSPIIVVATQSIEAGVNISFDIMFRELSPFDSIVQSAGRVNRFFEHSFSCPIYIFGTPEDYLPYKKYQLEITNNLLRTLNLKTEPDLFYALQEYWQQMKNYILEDEKKANSLYNAAKHISPFSIDLQEEKVDLRDTYLKISVVPIKYYDKIRELIENYEKLTTKKEFFRSKRILAVIESYMVEIPYWGKICDKNFKDFIHKEEGINFISLKYDETLGLLSQEDIEWRFFTS